MHYDFKTEEASQNARYICDPRTRAEVPRFWGSHSYVLFLIILIIHFLLLKLS